MRPAFGLPRSPTDARRASGRQRVARTPGFLATSLAGVAAGAAGTTALNAVTYLDMTLRGRAASSAPEDLVDELARRLHLRIPGDEDARSNRLAGLGPLTGLAAGVVAGATVGLVHGSGRRPPLPVAALAAAAVAMAAADAPVAVFGISNPTAWSRGDWLADAVPHVAYGLVAAVVLDRLVASAGGRR